MIPQVLDTNVLLRFLVGDSVKQKQQAEKWFKEAEKGTKKIVITSVVVAEATFVLESFYKTPREQIADSFEILLSQKWLTVDERDTLLALWPWYKRNLHFVDSYLLAWADTHQGHVVTFDIEMMKKKK